MRLKDTNIVFIGAGNVATHTAKAFHNNGIPIKAVYSRTEKSAKELADAVNATSICTLTALPKAEIYIYCVKDDVLPQIAAINSLRFPGSLHIHTSGSTPADVFKSQRYGVIYPMQTFSKEAKLNFKDIRCFIEGNTPEVQESIKELAESISNHVSVLNTEARLSLHIAAVFACNFANHCFALAGEILRDKSNLPFETLLPLIDETVNKIHKLSPAEAQTGPAVRFDEKILKKHLQLLESDEKKQSIYKMMSQSIHDTAIKSK